MVEEINQQRISIANEECIEWGEDSSPTRDEQLNREALLPRNDAESRQGFCAALCTIAFSIPALVGSWCWPVLLGAIVPSIGGSLNTSSSRSFSHALTWGINLAVLTNMLHYIYSKCKRSRKNHPHLRKWGPCYLLIAAIFLVLADLTRHLVNDAWGTQNCKSIVVDISQLNKINATHDPLPLTLPEGAAYIVCESHSIAAEYNKEGHLSAYGWTLTIFCTWTGFLCMVVGILWGIGLPKKIAFQWATLRRRVESPRQVPLLVQPDEGA